MTDRFELLRREHPEFDVATLPPIPDDWQDTTWRNDTCPSFKASNGVIVFVDYADRDQREIPECERFSARAPDTAQGNGDELAASEDDWNAILAAVNGYTPPEGFMTVEQFRATGRDVVDLGAEIPGQDLEGQSGRIYHGGAYLMLQVDGQWSLILGNEEYWEPLWALEERLYLWARDEGYFEDAA